MAARLEPGSPAPDFSLPDARGGTVSLADHRGRRVVVYFYPKASTPGCTTQACDFRDSLERFAADGFAVLGISPDSPEALARFASGASALSGGRLVVQILGAASGPFAEALRAHGADRVVDDLADLLVPA